MRSIYNIIGIVAFALLSCSKVSAADAKTTADACWADGIAAYEAKDYGLAVEKFEQIVELGYVSGRLYYNLANSYFKLGEQVTEEGGRQFSNGELGRAVLNYHRALRLDPTLEDARYNLELAVDNTNDTEALPESFISSVWRNMSNFAHSNSWAVGSLVMFGLMLACVLFFLLSGSVMVRRISFFVAIILLIGVIISVIFARFSKHQLEEDNRAVVVCNDTTPVHASPESGSKVIRQPSQGVTVWVSRSHGDWSEIIFADGEKGWIRSAKIEKI
jgi:hypothetical protein